MSDYLTSNGMEWQRCSAKTWYTHQMPLIRLKHKGAADPDVVAYVARMEQAINETYWAEWHERFLNLMNYGTSHPEHYDRPAPRADDLVQGVDGEWVKPWWTPQPLPAPSVRLTALADAILIGWPKPSPTTP